MQKTKFIPLISKFTAKDSPFRAIIPFLIATLLFVATITPLYAQRTQEITRSVYEKPTNLTTEETTTSSSMKPYSPQPTAIFCRNCGNQLLTTEGSCPFCNLDLSQWYQNIKK